MKSKHRILWIQDDASQVQTLKKALGDLYDLGTVRSTQDALELAAEFRPDLVLVDAACIEPAGMGFCRSLRGIPGARFVKILLLAQNVGWEDRLTAYGMGVDAVLEAPFGATELLSHSRLLLKLHDVERIDRLKTRLLHLLADPARTPLSGVTAPARLLTEDLDVDLEDRKRIASMVIDASEELQALVDRVVLLCEFQIGSVHLAYEPFDLTTLVDEVAGQLRAREDSDETIMKVYLPDTCPWVGSPHHLRMVVESLIDNALRYRKAGSLVEVTLNRTPRGARFCVSNESESLTSEQAQQLFETVALEEADPRRLGMSLPLARHILSEHGATIEFEVSERGLVRCLVEMPRLQVPLDSKGFDPAAAGVV